VIHARRPGPAPLDRSFETQAMIIRLAKETDRPAIAAVQAASWLTAYADILPKDYLDTRLHDDIAAHWRNQDIEDGDVVMVAEDTDLVGFIAIWVRPTPYIDNLHVLSGFRSKGVGRLLMRAGAKALLDAGQRTAFLWVAAGNTGAMRFYETLGGQLSERSDLDLFGNRVPNIKVSWPDIEAILTVT